jgi:hypothetical protein
LEKEVRNPDKEESKEEGLLISPYDLTNIQILKSTYTYIHNMDLRTFEQVISSNDMEALMVIEDL